MNLFNTHQVLSSRRAVPIAHSHLIVKIRMWFLEKPLLWVYLGLACFVWSFSSCGGGASVQQVAAAGDPVPLKIITTQLANGMVGQHYSIQMQSLGGGPPYTWSLVLGQLPPGVSLNATTGVMAGMPTKAGNYSFTVEVTDSTYSQPLTAIQSLSLTVNSPQSAATPGTVPLMVLTNQLTAAMVGQQYSFQIVSSGGNPPYIWSLALGQLPLGVSLNANTGAIAGMPTQAGTYSFEVAVKDSTPSQPLTAIQTLSLTVNPPQAACTSGTVPLMILTNQLVDGLVGQQYSFQMSLSGGDPPYAWSLAMGQLPPGVVLNANTGVMAGVPTQAGTYPFTVAVTDSTFLQPLKACQSLSLTVDSPPAAGALGAVPLTILTNQLVDGIVGQRYSYQMSLSGGDPPYAWSLAMGQLPPGVSLNANTGVMAGVPTQAGTYSFTVAVMDSTFSQTITAIQSLSLTVDPPHLVIVTPGLPGGIVGQPYQFQLQASGGTSPYTWSIADGSLAPGVQLNALTGEITGTPTEAGTSTVTIQVTDSSSPQYIAKLTLGERKLGEH